MTTNLRHIWLTPPRHDNRIYVTTPQGRGYLLLLTPLDEQKARDGLAVMVEGAERVEYFRVDEVEFEEKQ